MPIQFITPSIISSVANTQVTGTIIASQIATVNANTITSGTIPVAQIPQLTTAKMPTGSVLQVVQANTNTTVTVSTNTYTDTGLSASITPTSATSKILVLIDQQCVVNSYAGPNGLGLRLLRGSTTIFNPSPSDASGPFLIYGYAGNAIWTMLSLSYLDSPATTSSTTYKAQGRPYDSTLSSAVFQSGSTKATSVITLLEIAA